LGVYSAIAAIGEVCFYQQPMIHQLTNHNKL